jgi:hypothetical protein
VSQYLVPSQVIRLSLSSKALRLLIDNVYLWECLCTTTVSSILHHKILRQLQHQTLTRTQPSALSSAESVEDPSAVEDAEVQRRRILAEITGVARIEEGISLIRTINWLVKRLHQHLAWVGQRVHWPSFWLILFFFLLLRPCLF